MTKKNPKVGMKVRLRKDDKAKFRGDLITDIQQWNQWLREAHMGNPPYWVTKVTRLSDGQFIVSIAKGKKYYNRVNWFWLMPY